MSRGDEPVAAVVPFAAHDDGAASVRAAGEVRAGSRHRPAGAFHEILGWHTPRLRGTIELDRLLWRKDRLHPSITAIAKATAFVRSWVKVISTRETPNASARSFAFPARSTSGAPEGRLVTLMSCQRRPRYPPSALIAASRAAKRPAYDSAGRALASPYPVSSGGEKRRPHLGMAGRGPPTPADLPMSSAQPT